MSAPYFLFNGFFFFFFYLFIFYGMYPEFGVMLTRKIVSTQHGLSFCPISIKECPSLLLQSNWHRSPTAHTRIVFRVPCRHLSSEIFNSLHWLLIEERIIFKIPLHIYKSLKELLTNIWSLALRSASLQEKAFALRYVGRNSSCRP